MKFVIVSQARSGSSLLGEMLGSHTSVHCDGELFNEHTLKKKWGKIGQWLAFEFPYIVVWLHQRNSPKPHYGFKLLLSQAKDPNQLLDVLTRKGYVTINLMRENNLDKAFSAAIAYTTGSWYVSDKNKRIAGTISISEDLLLTRLAHTENQNKLQQSLFKNRAHIPVSYEQDLADEEKQVSFSERICRDLSLPFEPLRARCIKTDQRHLSERISNYNALIEMVKKSKYAVYL